MPIVLRDYQAADVEGIRDAFRQRHRSVLYVLPTGGGKTVVLSHIAELSARKGSSIMIVAHRRELIRQASAALRGFGIPHGIIAPGAPETADGVQVAMVGSLASRLRRRPDAYRADVLIIDEAHHATPGSQWGQVAEHFHDARLLGVTATPRRLDGRGLGVAAGGFFEHMHCGPSVSDLIQRGHLVRPVTYGPKQPIDLSSVKVVCGDFSISQLEGAVDTPTITGDAIVEYRRHLHRQPAIAFCVSVAHAVHVAEEFQSAGYRAAMLSGDTEPASRERMIADLGAGELDVLTACDVISEGTDIPRVAGVIQLRPTKSESLYLQQVGRGLRPYPGKHACIVLDHAGNIWQHGSIVDDRDWSLEGKPRRKRGDTAPADDIRQCPECYTIYPASADECPECGHRPPNAGRAPPQEVAGDLREIDTAALSRRKDAERAAAKTLDDLIAIGKQRGYHSGWAHHVYKSRLKKQQQQEAAS